MISLLIAAKEIDYELMRQSSSVADSVQGQFSQWQRTAVNKVVLFKVTQRGGGMRMEGLDFVPEGRQWLGFLVKDYHCCCCWASVLSPFPWSVV